MSKRDKMTSGRALGLALDKGKEFMERQGLKRLGVSDDDLRLSRLVFQADGMQAALGPERGPTAFLISRTLRARPYEPGTMRTFMAEHGPSLKGNILSSEEVDWNATWHLATLGREGALITLEALEAQRRTAH